MKKNKSTAVIASTVNSLALLFAAPALGQNQILLKTDVVVSQKREYGPGYSFTHEFSPPSAKPGCEITFLSTKNPVTIKAGTILNSKDGIQSMTYGTYLPEYVETYQHMTLTTDEVDGVSSTLTCSETLRSGYREPYLFNVDQVKGVTSSLIEIR